MNLYTKIIHLVPEYPPQVGGVADFSHILLNALESYNLPQEVIVAGIKKYPEAKLLEGISIVHSFRDLYKILDQRCDSGTLLIFHYVCYGFSVRGIPVGLPSIIRNVKKK